MKSLIIATVLFLHSALPVFAQGVATVSASPSPTPNVLGLYDEELDSTDSASTSATPEPTPDSSVRTTTYLDPSDAPVSGTFETSLIILFMGVSFIVLGIRFSR
jgi:hypothetical protein